MDPVFQEAIETVLKHEGGFVNDPDDPGGATNFGVSLRYLRSVGAIDVDQDGILDFDFDGDGDIDEFDVRSMSREDAINVYRDFWWDKYHYSELPPVVGIKVFDIAVNMGSRQTHKCLQRAVRACGITGIEDDGVLGPMTRRAILRVDPHILVASFRSEAAGVYRQIVARRATASKYLMGWLTRAYA